MAFGVVEFRRHLRGIFGFAEDSTNDVLTRVKNAAGTTVQHKNDGNAATATAFASQAVYTAVNPGRLMSARYVQSTSSTVSTTDYYIVNLIKYSASTWSATTLLARLAGSTTTTVSGYLTNNLARASNEFTLSSSSAELTLAEGDTIVLTVTRNGATGVGQGLPNGVLVMEFA